MSKKIYQADTVINLPPQETFSFTVNVNNFPLWSGVKRVEAIKQLPEVVGSQYLIVSPTLLSETSITIEITKHSPFIDWGFKYLSSTSITEFSYHFEQVAEGTKVTVTFEQDTNFILSLISKITSQKSLEDLLENLKEALESPNPQTTPA